MHDHAFKSLHLFFRHGDSTIKQKMQAYNAFIESKMMYGLDTMVFKQSVKKSLDAFHLKGMRTIMKFPTTYLI